MSKKSRNVVFIIAVIILLLMFGVKYFGIDKKHVNEKELTKNEFVEKCIVNRFDMNNTQNAKIIGNIKQNISNKLLEEKTYFDLKISDIKLESNNTTGVTTFMAVIENLGSSTHAEENVRIILLKEDGSELATIDGIIGEIKSGEKIELASYTGTDIANAYDFKIEKVQK